MLTLRTNVCLRKLLMSNKQPDWVRKIHLGVAGFVASWDQTESKIIDNYVNGDDFEREGIAEMLMELGFKELYQKCLDRYEERKTC